MKKTLLSIFLITVLGCSSNDENKEVIADKKLITEIELDVKNNMSETRNYFYTEGMLTKIRTIDHNKDIFEDVFNYKNNKIESITHLKNNLNIGSNSFYYENGLITRSESKEDNITFINSYIYDGVGSLKTIQETSGNKVIQQSSFEYKNTSLSGINTTIKNVNDPKGSLIYKATYESDSENSPYLNVYTKELINIWLPFPVQNVSTQTNSNGDVYTYEYIYENHKPIQVIEKLSGTSISKTTYIYE
ncbi:hypothetical protein EV143_1322 [Flavobacterium chryseum]|uniref:hypothetical protein n=1 Tax=Flavobacterium sp. P3160 TaxID=2512113 RepID=UPI001061F114|nr:hypothetical protein [Flavobacterium sp. P3160]TDO67091.1 hypothetical protein EV143_1322 [Flavobacterium sp. P3160]